MPQIGDSRSSDKPAVFIPSIDRRCHNQLGHPKVKYESKAEAKQALKRMVHRDRRGLPAQRNAKAYRCKACNFFHIGHD